jgi:hypothetical protein
MQYVRYMPDLNTSLLSVSKLEDCGIYVNSRLGFLDLTCDGKTLATARRNGGSYVLELGTKNTETAFPAQGSVEKPDEAKKPIAPTWDLLHARPAHVGDHFIATLPGITEEFHQLPIRPKGPKKACDPCA